MQNSSKTKSKGSRKARASKAGQGSKEKAKSSLTPEGLEKLCFGRHPYADTDAAFTKRSMNIALFCQNLYIYEIWNRLPDIFTEIEPLGDAASKEGSQKESKSKSNGSKSKSGGKSKGKKTSKASKSKSSQGKKNGQGQLKEKSYDEPVIVDDLPDMPECEKALLIGAVAFPYCLTASGAKIYVEVTADFVYCDYARKPPYPPGILCKTRCYHNIVQVFQPDIEHLPLFLPFTQNLVAKVKEEFPKGWHAYPFLFDLTSKPDTVLFSRPYYSSRNTGLFWTLRAFAGMTEFCTPSPENEVLMDFYKFTLTPVAKPSVTRPSVSLNYSRWSCLEDQGSLTLSASLSKDVFYQGEEVEVTVTISNDSVRHSVVEMTLCVEQTTEFHSEIPHTNRIALAIVFVRTGDLGLPIGPKNRGWVNTFRLRPVYDPSKYNIAVDGRMSKDKKIFLAESTVVVDQEWIKVEEAQPNPEKDKSKSKKNGKKSNGKEKGSKKGSGKGSKSSSKENKTPKNDKVDEPSLENKPECQPPPLLVRYDKKNVITTRQECRIIDVSYEVVVRLTLGNGAGQPMVSLPFVLTRNSRYVDKLPLRMPPVFATVELH
ncbi:hypothetical protein Aperf_G00000113756 [Anoplocephala perfoliata]